MRCCRLILDPFSMHAQINNPFVVFAFALLAQGLAIFAGDFLRRHTHHFKQGERHDFNTVQAATLTLLALIVGFSFSMAVTRYDQRKSLEEAEANAIGTQYLRADLLPGELRGPMRDLLRKYLELRIAYYEARDESEVRDIDQHTATLQAE